jgi:class 3 adenylate cyclase
MVAEAHAAGATPDDLTRIVLVFADSIRRVVAAQRDFSNQVLVQPYLEAGGSTAEAVIDTLEARTRYRDLGRRLLLLLHTRFIEDISFQTVVELTEAALAAKGISPAKPATMPAIAFVDQTGYTRMTGDLGDAAAAGAAARLAERAQVTSASNDGRLVKLLGDGVLLYFRDAASAVKSTLELQAQSAEEDLAPLHAGIETGPVLARDGDFFGTVVNVSARIADYARPGEVLVTRAVVDAWGGGGGVAFDEIGQTPLKNVARPVELFRARPSSAD